jgi:hypothetical protein
VVTTYIDWLAVLALPPMSSLLFLDRYPMPSGFFVRVPASVDDEFCADYHFLLAFYVLHSSNA